jgi:hypothetical protein
VVVVLSISICYFLYFMQNTIKTTSDTQWNPPSWGMDRIDDVYYQDGNYEYYYTGTGIHAYVLDTPMKNQTEFGNRFLSCKDAIGVSCSITATNPHATHVGGAYIQMAE